MLIKREKLTYRLTRRYLLLASLRDEFPKEEEIQLDCSEEEWELIEYFTATLEIPTSRATWSSLLQTGDYLILNPSFSEILHSYALKELEKEKIPLFDPKIKLIEIAMKFKDSTYRTPREKCSFLRDPKMGYYCNKDVVYGQRHCATCINKQRL